MEANLKEAQSCVQRHGARKKHGRFWYILTELLSTGDRAKTTNMISLFSEAAVMNMGFKEGKLRGSCF